MTQTKKQVITPEIGGEYYMWNDKHLLQRVKIRAANKKDFIYSPFGINDYLDVVMGHGFNYNIACKVSELEKYLEEFSGRYDGDSVK